MATRAEMEAAVKKVTELSGGEPDEEAIKTIGAALVKLTLEAGGDLPEAQLFACKDGSIRFLTMTEADPVCEGCDCGYAALLDDATY